MEVQARWLIKGGRARSRSSVSESEGRRKKKELTSKWSRLELAGPELQPMESIVVVVFVVVAEYRVLAPILNVLLAPLSLSLPVGLGCPIGNEPQRASVME